MDEIVCLAFVQRLPSAVQSYLFAFVNPVVYHHGHKNLPLQLVMKAMISKKFLSNIFCLLSTEGICVKRNSILDNIHTRIRTYSTRSPFVPCLSRHAQSGRRTFERQVWFIESHIGLVIFYFLMDLFIHLFLIQKACCYPVKQLNHFLVKYQSLHLHSLTHALLLLHCSLTGLLVCVICC